MTDHAVDTQSFAKRINELLVLAALRDEPKHGYQIGLDVEAASGGMFVFQHGTLYPILHRLEAAGLIAGRWEAHGGRRRKVYEITRAGLRHLEQDRERCRVTFLRLLEVLG
ncbi:MAG TPA: helix-turn-helix transcriptional regulator [Longimicrobiales bacterium]|nr:helix-turn-helix transcriptional regulator [Longimicrobiales bacterium]